MRTESHFSSPSRFPGLPASAAKALQARRTGGFSLVELLVVLVILILLTSLYWGSGSSKRQRQLQTTCQQNLQKAYLALDIFGKEHGGFFPEVQGARTSEEALDLLVPRYTSDTSVFICPGGKDSPLTPGQSLHEGKISYAYYMGRNAKDSQEALMSDRQVDTQAKTAGQVVFSTTGKPPGNNHHQYGGNVLFVDGRVELSPAHASMALGLPKGVVLLNPK